MFDAKTNKFLSDRELRDVYREHQRIRKKRGECVKTKKLVYYRTNQPRIYNNLLKEAMKKVEIDPTGNYYLSNYRAVLSYFRDSLKLSPVQVEFLVWSRGYKWFCVEEAKTLFLVGNNIKMILNKLLEEGYIEIKYYGSKKKRVHYRYGISLKGKKIVSYFYDMLEKGKIPENY